MLHSVSGVRPALEEFESILKRTEVHSEFEFDFDTDFSRLYFGRDRKRHVTYSEFTQLLFVRTTWLNIISSAGEFT